MSGSGHFQVLAESKARGVHANNRVMFMFLRAAGSAALSPPQVAAVFAEVAALRARCQLERRSAPAPATPGCFAVEMGRAAWHGRRALLSVAIGVAHAME